MPASRYCWSRKLRFACGPSKTKGARGKSDSRRGEQGREWCVCAGRRAPVVSMLLARHAHFSPRLRSSRRCLLCSPAAPLLPSRPPLLFIRGLRRWMSGLGLSSADYSALAVTTGLLAEVIARRLALAYTQEFKAPEVQRGEERREGATGRETTSSAHSSHRESGGTAAQRTRLAQSDASACLPLAHACLPSLRSSNPSSNTSAPTLLSP